MSGKNSWAYQYSLQCARERNGGKLPSPLYKKTSNQLHEMLFWMTNGKHNGSYHMTKQKLVDKVIRLQNKPDRDAAKVLERAAKKAEKEEATRVLVAKLAVERKAATEAPAKETFVVPVDTNQKQATVSTLTKTDPQPLHVGIKREFSVLVDAHGQNISGGPARAVFTV